MVSLQDALVETLKALGVSHVFGVSGANIEHLHDGIARRGAGITEAILTKSEIGAAFMADGLARCSGRLAVCCATSGGGMMNLAVGLAEAFASQVPLLALVGQAPDTLDGQGAFQDSSGAEGTVDGRALFGALSRYVAVLNDAASFWLTLRAALIAALKRPFGPAVLLVPRNHWEDVVSPDDDHLARNIRLILQSVKTAKRLPLATEKNLLTGTMRAAYNLISQAQYPLAIIGPQLGWDEARELDGLLQQLQMPTASTLGSLSQVAQSAKGYLGTVGVPGHPSVHRYLEQKCDLIILVGTALEIMHRAPIERSLSNRQVLTFGVDHRLLPDYLKARRLADHSLSDLGLLLEKMVDDGIDKSASTQGYRQTWIKPKLADPAADSLPNEQKLTSPLRQSQCFAVLQPFLAACDQLFLDAGNCAAAAAHYLKVPAGVKSVIALGMGGMGYAIAAAIGAKIGQSEPPRTGIVIAGDGAFLMTGMELHTAFEQRLPMLFLFFNNASHGMCVTRQNLSFAGRIIASRYTPLDIAQVATGLAGGGPAFIKRVKTGAALQAALTDYFENHRDVTGVLDLVIEEEELPPFLSLNPHFEEYELP